MHVNNSVTVKTGFLYTMADSLKKLKDIITFFVLFYVLESK